MATTNNKNNDLKSQAKYINKVALEVGGDIVKLAVKNGETSQAIFSKVVKGGVTLLGMQQDFALTILEKVAGNVKSNKYFQDSFKKYSEAKETVEKTVEKQVETVSENKYVKESLKKYAAVKETVAERVEFVKEKATEVYEQVKSNLNIAEEIPANIEEKAVETTEKVEEALEAVEETIEEIKSETVETIEETAEEVATEATEMVKKVKADNITKIKGLGAKTAEILNAAGFDSFEKLANATVEELNAILEEAGAAFKKFDPTPWIEAAKQELNEELK